MARTFMIPLIILGLAGSLDAWPLNDPTRPTDPSHYFGHSSTTGPSGLMLQSILVAPERRIAVINGMRVQEGDRVGSARVVTIQDSQVLLETSRGMRTLRLLPQTLKR